MSCIPPTTHTCLQLCTFHLVTITEVLYQQRVCILKEKEDLKKRITQIKSDSECGHKMGDPGGKMGEFNCCKCLTMLEKLLFIESPFEGRQQTNDAGSWLAAPNIGTIS